MARESEDDQRRPEETSGGGDREDWFEEGGCPESSKVERRSASNRRRNGVNLAISARGQHYKNQITITTTTTFLIHITLRLGAFL